jgi:hypothetical protein
MQISLKNLGTVNKNLVQIGSVKIWFSYETPVAYQIGKCKIIVCENIYSQTTGKLLNQLQIDKKLRVPANDFKEAINKILSGLTFSATSFVSRSIAYNELKSLTCPDCFSENGTHSRPSCNE